MSMPGANMLAFNFLFAQRAQEAAAEKARAEAEERVKGVTPFEGRCQQCGRAIYRVENRKYRDGFYWDHIDGTFRHIAKPVEETP